MTREQNHTRFYSKAKYYEIGFNLKNVKALTLTVALWVLFMNSTAKADSPKIQFVGKHDKAFQKLIDKSISSLIEFSNSNRLGIVKAKDFVDEVILYESKEAFDKMITSSPDWPKETNVPATYVGLGQKKKFHVISWSAYQKVHPKDSVSDYQKLLTHELAHLAHVAFLKNDEDRMGPIWFYEGFACFVANQYETAELPKKDRISQILSQDTRASYPEYVAIFRTLVRYKPVDELLKNEKPKGLSDWAMRTLLKEAISK